MRRPSAVLATAVVVLALAGCGSPTTTGAPVSTHSPSSGAPAGPAFDPSSSALVIDVAAGHATIAGNQGTTRVRVYGDGRVERTALDTISVEQLRLDRRGVATLLGAADRLGLLSGPDLGDVMITDVGSTSLTIRLQDRTIDLDVIGPGITGVGSPAVERARANFSAFLSQLQTLDGVGIAQQPRTIQPRTVAVSAFPIQGQNSDDPWPLGMPARSVFATSACALVSGDDVQRLAALLTEQQRRRASRQYGGVVVATGDLGVPALVLRISSEHPQCTPAPAVRTPLPTPPWPAEDRERAGQWQRWQADGALAVARDRGALPVSDLDDYEFQYVAGTVAGMQVVDVVGTPDDQHTGRDGVRAFTARVDLVRAGRPVVSKTVVG